MKLGVIGLKFFPSALSLFFREQRAKVFILSFHVRKAPISLLLVIRVVCPVLKSPSSEPRNTKIAKVLAVFARYPHKSFGAQYR